MVIDTATPEESLAALERWARASGCWEAGHPPPLAARKHESWIFGPAMFDDANVCVWDPARTTWRDETPEVAVALALALDSGLPPVDVVKVPSGRETVDVARLVLDAAPRLWSETPEFPLHADVAPSDVADVIVTRNDGVRETWRLGCARARKHLSVLADQLQASGNPLGEVLSLLLHRHQLGDDQGTGVGVRALTATCDRLAKQG